MLRIVGILCNQLTFLACFSCSLTAHLPPDKGTIAVGVLAGVLGFIFVLLLAALGAIICKPRGAPKPTGAVATLLVRDAEPG